MERMWILLLVFGATFALVQAAYVTFVRPRAGRRAVNRRLSSTRDGTRDEVARQQLRRERWLGAGPVSRFLIQSGLKLSPAGLVSCFIALAALLTLALFVLVDNAALSLAAAAPLALFVTYLHIALSRRARIKQFAAQLPDALDVMVRSLRAGHPVPRALALVAGEMKAPAGAEFGVVADEITYGAELTMAVEALYARVGEPDLRLLVAALAIQNATGGGLVEVLGNLAALIRERGKLGRKVRGLSAEGRYSAILLSVLPFLFFGILNLVSREFYGEVWSDPMVPRALMGGVLMMIVGNFIMYRMVNYKV